MRNAYHPMLQQIVKQKGTLVLVYVPPLLVLFFVSIQSKVPVSELTRDTVSVGNLPYYTGALSNLGVLLWCAAASVCLFSSLMLFVNRSTQRTKWMLLFGGLLTGFLMMDDFFIIHEVFAYVFDIPDTLILAIYLVFGGAWLIVFHREILSSDFLLLILALIFLAISFLVDIPYRGRIEFLSVGSDAGYLLEDGTKFLGITSWLGYFLRYCLMTLSSPSSVKDKKVSLSIHKNRPGIL